MTHPALACRSCADTNLAPVLFLGKTPLADRLLTETMLAEREPVFPLTLHFCAACGLVQIAECVAPEQLYCEDYPYYSSFSDALLKHSRDNVEEVGDEMVTNPLVKGISFTGSTPVGRQIAAKAGAHLKRCCVELGGKDALIVCEDADLERATGAANFGSFMHQGQICMSVEKVIVHERIFDAFLERFVERAAKLKVGDPMADKSNVIGPLINDKQAARVRQ